MKKAQEQRSLMDVEGDVDQDAVLDALRTFREEHLQRERSVVLLAAQWARANPGLKRTWPDGTPNTSRVGVVIEDLIWEELADKGCPYVDDLSIPTFAVAAGLSEFQARNLVRESVMLVHLLPRVWALAQEGTVDVWRVRKLADECWDLTPEAVDYVDRLMSLSTARHTEGGRAGVIKEARLRYMAEAVQAEEEADSQEQFFEVITEQTGAGGLASISGLLDLPDALDLEKAVAAGAQMLKKMGSDAPLERRRSWALGDIARGAQVGQEALFGSAARPREGMECAPQFKPDCACALGLHPPGRAAPAGSTMLYLHLAPDSIVPSAAGGSDIDGVHPQNLAISTNTDNSEGTAVPSSARGVVRVQGPSIPPGYVVSSDVIKSWLTRPICGPSPKIFFRPVIDLNEHARVDAYEVPDRLKERVNLRDGTCVFPWCNRRAEATDCDHSIPWKPGDRGGPTCSCNLAPLCRRHHRAKTHADNHSGNKYTWWNYEALGDGQYLWTGPKGTVLLRTNTGAVEVSRNHASRQKRVSAAQKTVSKIIENLPAVDQEALEADEATLEFPTEPPQKRAPSWRDFSDTPDVSEDPPNVAPGGLADRVLQHRKRVHSAMETQLRQYHTGLELRMTAADRRARERDRQRIEKARQGKPWLVGSGRFAKCQQIIGGEVVWYLIPHHN